MKLILTSEISIKSHELWKSSLWAISFSSHTFN